MGQTSSGLTQDDVDEVIQYCNELFDQSEIEGLYKRFRSLDRGRKGYISGEEFLAIPELSINPIASRLVRLFESVNFKEFVKLLSALSRRASDDEKLGYMFMVYDIDADGIVSREDMGVMLRQLAGSSLSEEELRELVEKVMEEAGARDGLDFDAFKKALEGSDLSGMVVEVPVEV
mmetsp:Transcript_5238/g.11462  ORF Transcript_5238/g.11462 Transcript_5238/m.11462 type:complete len:176 (+) Transcript_5238:110-637(+)|eukprot:CAMPEP_0202892410 /NCGR_PEP_ID=MMETSP1392-20130828/2129_1 /ASSEMBLY_ACC=CAM_ASM_000868 /TAXON_ID=225041 /ORGANISM="Chlamydomonas chlamydogama, Strain SAG 11-48b" /LENGTH=175 /DNA_ID=CAMNT_0049576345 /DNA_START=94 /DNA_END=621 /DNA_ORIENTATION=-